MSIPDERPPAEIWDPPELMDEKRQRNPYPWFAEKRSRGPVHYDGDRDVFDVFGYDEIVEVLSDWELFSNRKTKSLGGSLMDYDPPKQTDLRKMISGPFEPSKITNMRVNIEQRADEILDEALSGEGELDIDFVADVAEPLPIMLIADIIGVPPEKRDTFRKWSKDLHATPADDSEEAEQETIERQRQARDNLLGFFKTELEKREENPKDDLITTMLRVEQNSDLVDRENTIANGAILLAAGNHTTTSFMTNAMWTYIEEGVVQELKRGDINLGAANEEVLRYRGPVNQLKRFAMEDTELGGMDVPAGSKMVLHLLSAHRDESVYDDPDEFRPGRNFSKEPIPFGKGNHYCIGSQLAKLEAEVLLGKFLERIDDVELLVDEIDPVVSMQIFTAEELPLRVSV